MDFRDLEYVNTLLDRDAELREKIKEEVSEFDKKARLMSGVLNKIHSTPSHSLPSLLDNVMPTLISCRDTTAALADLVPLNHFWHYRDMWTNSMRTAVFVAALTEYLTSRTLISVTKTEEILGIKEEWKGRFALPIEDYLHGVLNVVNELSRLAVNAVTMGDFEEPIKISAFVQDLFAGFSTLNLRNDTLRRKFDGLKYDIKKIEEVVYDVSLRNLVSSRSTSPPQKKTS